MATDYAVTRLPDALEITERVLDVLDEPGFACLLAKNGLQQKNGRGVVMMIYLAINDYAEGMPPIMAAMMRMQIKDFVAALVDDEAVKKDAFDVIDRVTTKMEEQENNRPPAPARPDLTDDDKVALMVHIKRLATIFDEHVADKGRLSRGYRVDGANPFYNQTLNGLYLEYYYGTPSKVWTPWGEWHFAVTQLYEIKLDDFMSQLSVREHIPEHNTVQGTIGPVYAILAIDGVELPEPVLPTDKRQYLDRDVAKAEWERFFGGEA